MPRRVFCSCQRSTFLAGLKERFELGEQRLSVLGVLGMGRVSPDVAPVLLKPNMTRQTLNYKDIQSLRNGVQPRDVPSHGGEERLSRFDRKFSQEPRKVFAQ